MVAPPILTVDASTESEAESTTASDLPLKPTEMKEEIVHNTKHICTFQSEVLNMIEMLLSSVQSTWMPRITSLIAKEKYHYMLAIRY